MVRLAQSYLCRLPLTECKAVMNLTEMEAKVSSIPNPPLPTTSPHAYNRFAKPQTEILGAHPLL